MSSIQVYTSNGYKYVRIIESYRVPGHKNPKVRVLKNLGREDELEVKEPGIVERLKREHNAFRAADAAVKQDYFVEEIKSLLKAEDSSETEGFPLVNYGV